MRHIFDRNGSRAFLNHLKAQTTMNKDFFSDLWPWQANVDHDIKQFLVSTDSGVHRLCETALPCLSALSLGLIPVLELDEPYDPAWTFLERYGVVTTLGLDFYLRQLKSLKTQGDLRVLNEKLLKIYKSLESFADQRETIL